MNISQIGYCMINHLIIIDNPRINHQEINHPEINHPEINHPGVNHLGIDFFGINFPTTMMEHVGHTILSLSLMSR